MVVTWQHFEGTHLGPWLFAPDPTGRSISADVVLAFQFDQQAVRSSTSGSAPTSLPCSSRWVAPWCRQLHQRLHRPTRATRAYRRRRLGGACCRPEVTARTTASTRSRRSAGGHGRTERQATPAVSCPDALTATDAAVAGRPRSCGRSTVNTAHQPEVDRVPPPLTWLARTAPKTDNAAAVANTAKGLERQNDPRFRHDCLGAHDGNDGPNQPDDHERDLEVERFGAVVPDEVVASTFGEADDQRQDHGQHQRAKVRQQGERRTGRLLVRRPSAVDVSPPRPSIPPPQRRSVVIPPRRRQPSRVRRERDSLDPRPHRPSE